MRNRSITARNLEMDENQLIDFFHLFYECIPDPILLVNNDDGTILVANRLARLWIVDDKNISHTSIHDLIPGIKDLKDIPESTLYLKVRLIEGIEKTAEIIVQPLSSQSCKYTILVIQQEESGKTAIIKPKGRLDYSLLNAVGNGVIILDFEGVVQFVNDVAINIVKYPSEQLLQTNIYTIFFTCKNKRPLVKRTDCILLQNIQKQKKVRKEETIYRSDGEPLAIEYILNPLQEEGKTMGMVLTFKNISHQKEFEESLKENEERFRSMFQNSFDTITIMDKKGRVKFTSSKDGNVFDYVFNDVLGKDMTQRIKLEQIKNTELAFEFAFWDALANPHKSIRVEHRSRRLKDGEYVYVESIISNHINNPSINGMVVNSREITERVIAERSLSRQHNLLKAIINSTPDLIYIKNMEGQYLECNLAFCNFAGLSEPEIINKTDRDLFDPRIAVVFKSMDNRTLKNGQINSSEIWLTYPDGKKVLFEALISPYMSNSGEILGIVGIGRDVTERKMNEQLLRDNEARLKEVQTISQIGSFEYDLITQSASFSDNYLSILGIDDKSIISSFRLDNFIKHVHPDDQQIVMDSIQGALFEFRRYKFTYRIYTLEGQIRYIYTICNYHYDNMGNPVKLISSIQDITQQKLNEELQRNIDLAKKTAEIKQQFLANMSHEMRTPMTGILGMIDFLLTTKLDNGQLDYALTIKNSANSLLNIINDVLLLSKIEAGKLRLFPRVFTVKDTLVDLQSLFSAFIKHKHIELLIHIDPDVPELLEADENRLKQVITNLLSNAVKFTDQGKIEISLTVDKKTETEVVLLFKVIDTGIGIDSEDKEILFTQFSQADSSLSRNYEGIGLGLTISKQLIHLMHGEIGLESEKGKGSIFWFTIKSKIVKGELLKPEEKNTQKMENYNFKAHVLVVEDKFVNSKVVTMMLESLGATADVATNGYEALEIFEPGKYQLIFMDIQMPSMDGVATVKKLREEYTDLPPIVGLSANAMEGDAEKYIKEGMDDYLSKPVTLDIMQEKMLKWIDRKYIQGLMDDLEKRDEKKESKEEGKSDDSFINPQTIKIIYQQSKGNSEILSELFNSFMSDTEELLASLKQYYTNKEYNKAKENAHTIKGLCATIGATKMHELATRIDQYLKNGTPKQVADLIPNLEENYNMIKEYIHKEHLQKLTKD